MLYDVPVWFFDGFAWPGWVDYLGLSLTLAGFGFTIWQLLETKKETRAATKALRRAQRQLSKQALLVLVPHFHTVSSDLSYALGANDVQVASRAIVRFSHLAQETNGVLAGLEGDHALLSTRLSTAAKRATKAKGELASSGDPDVGALVKKVAADIETLGADMTGLSSSIRNTIEGVNDAER